jgi:hypothetical protein
MRTNNLKNRLAVSAFGLTLLLGMSDAVGAQTRNRNENFPPQGNGQYQRGEQYRIEQQRIELERQRIQAEQIRLEQQRQEQIRLEQLRIQNERNQSVYNRNVRYRVFQGGRVFIVDQRGLDLLKQAVIRGYEEGFKSGQSDRWGRKRGGFGSSPVYQSGNYGYQNFVEARQYQFYFKKGFEEGYGDGFSSRKQRGWGRDDAKINKGELRDILKFQKI